MTFDLNDAEPQQQQGALIPNGTFACVTMTLRPGGIDGTVPADRGLLTASKALDSDVQMLNAEFTILEGPHARRKVWRNLIVAGGKRNEHGVSIGWTITKSLIRAILESHHGVRPEDQSPKAQAARRIAALRDLDGLSFVARIKVEPSANARYGPRNTIDRAVTPEDPAWAATRDGRPPAPKATPSPLSAPQTAHWPAAPATASPTADEPDWAPRPDTAPPPAPVPSQGSGSIGPAWLNE